MPGSPSHPAAELPWVTQRCLASECGAVHPVGATLTSCPRCGELLDVVYDWDVTPRRPRSWSDLIRPPTGDGPAAASGVWMFRDLLPFSPPTQPPVSIGEGRTILQRADALAERLGLRPGGGGLHLQYEGFNPSGSFKDNGMAAGITHARMAGARTVACASTGNTSASMALYAAHAGEGGGMRAVVFIGQGKIALGKLSQSLDYGATTIQIAGDFDACLARVREIADDPRRGVYLLNSVNPFRLEGQKTIMFRVLRDLGWRVPDWIVVPGGNLGNCSAFAKAFLELRTLGLIDRLPRLAVINAEGARTLDRIYNELGARWTPAPGDTSGLCGSYDRRAVQAEFERMDRAGERASTLASAIEINRPVNLPKALRALWAMDGVVRSVTDEDILEHKSMVGRFGLGCEPASAASVAGAHLLVGEGVIKPDQTVVCVLTGHQLKDPDATMRYHSVTQAGTLRNAPIAVPDDPQAIARAMGL